MSERKRRGGQITGPHSTRVVGLFEEEAESSGQSIAQLHVLGRKNHHGIQGSNRAMFSASSSAR